MDSDTRSVPEPSADALARLANEQIELSRKVRIAPLDVARTRFVAGVDCAYWVEGGSEMCACAAVLYDTERDEVFEKASSFGAVDFPYISGFLAYREADLMIEALRELQERHAIDAILVDGNGMLHVRQAGEAVAVGAALGIPTIGIAKKYCRIDGADHEFLGNAAGSMGDISLDGCVIGRALRTHSGVKPVYVSVGNLADLDSACDLVFSKLVNKESRVPIPTRQADIETHLLRKAAKEGCGARA